VVEFIQKAAIRRYEIIYSVDRPGRHQQVFEAMFPVDNSEQGFLTNTGRFVGREEAGHIALASGQIAALKWPPRLYTEDLW
jgi:hypothetical protein